MGVDLTCQIGRTYGIDAMSVLQRGLSNQDAVFTAVSIRPRPAFIKTLQALARVFAQQTGNTPPRC